MKSTNYKSTGSIGNYDVHADTLDGLRQRIRELEHLNGSLKTENSGLIKTLERYDDFVALLTHDLKSPLIGSNQVLEAMINGTMASEQKTVLLEKLLTSNNEMLRLIWNVLDSYKIRGSGLSPQITSVNLLSLIHASLHDFAYQISHKNIQCELIIPATLPNIDTDFKLLRRAVINLIDNAIKFTPPHGKIQVTSKLENSWLSFSVVDSGSGIPYEQRAQLFKKFFQAKDGIADNTGTGLGLCLSKSLIELLNGTLEYRSSEEGGAIFTIALPRNRAPKRRPNSAPDLNLSPNLNPS